jgi:hypothetical protein
VDDFGNITRFIRADGGTANAFGLFDEEFLGSLFIGWRRTFRPQLLEHGVGIYVIKAARGGALLA